MFRTAIAACIVTGLMLSGCTSTRSKSALVPPACPGPDTYVESLPTTDWIGAGAVAPSAETRQSAPPADLPPPVKPTWKTKLMKKGENALKETAGFLFVAGIVVVAAGVLLLYAYAAGETSSSLR